MLITPILISSVGQWLVQHHAEIPELVQRSSAFLNDLILQGSLSNTVKRVGNNLIWNSPGGASVLAHLDQLDAGIDGIGIAQRGMQAGLVGLKSLSMVTLGFSAVSTGLIAAQFVYLGRRLNQIQKELKKIQLMIDQSIEAQLKAGIDFLQQAENTVGERKAQCLHDALERARDAGPLF